MNKDKRNLIVYALTYTILFSSQGINLYNFLHKNNNGLSQNDFTTSIQSEPNDEEKECPVDSTLEINDKIEETIIPTILETVEQNIETPSNINDTSIIETIIDKFVHKDIMVSALENTYIYSNNTTLSIKIGKIKINEKAIKILSDDDWTLVNYNNTIGYISNNCLTETNEFIKTEYKHKLYKDVVIVTTDLNFRKEPNTSSEIIKTFIKNTELEVLAKVDNGWLLVRNNGVLGYVHGNYTISLLDKAKKMYPDLNLDSLSFKKIIYSKVDNLNMKNSNDSECEITENFEKYESSRVINEYDDLYFVMTNEYNFGFIDKKDTEELKNIFVTVDLSRQLLYLYNNNILYCVTPIISGKPSTPSDIGLFEIWYKETDCYITDNAFTNFWMPYNYFMEGLHDAISWRNDSEFIIREPNKERNDPVNGSNGCINMMYEPAKLVFENAEIGTKVLVHK